MNTDQDREQISELLERCIFLCGEAENQLDNLSSDRCAFLSTSVTEALQQLELMLRIVEDEQEDSPQRQARQGLLKRLFQRGEDGSTGEEFQPPSFDVSKMGLHGNTSTIPITELLSFLAYGSKTGVLWVDSPNENFLVGIVEGQLRHANSDQTPPGLRLGEVLVHLGCLTERQLGRHLGRHSDDTAIESVTGESLLDSGIISDEELGAALSYQTRALFERLTSTSSAVFRFREGMEVSLAYQVELDINQLLLDYARVQDEAAHASAQAAAAAVAAVAMADSANIEGILSEVFVEGEAKPEEGKDEESQGEVAEPTAKTAGSKSKKASANAKDSDQGEGKSESTEEEEEEEQAA